MVSRTQLSGPLCLWQCFVLTLGRQLFDRVSSVQVSSFFVVFVPLHYQSISLSIHGCGAFQRPLFKTDWVFTFTYGVSVHLDAISSQQSEEKMQLRQSFFFPFRDFSGCPARLSFFRPDLLNIFEILCHTYVAPTSSSKPCLVPTCGTTILLHLVQLHYSSWVPTCGTTLLLHLAQLYYSSWVPTPAIISSTIKQWLPSEANATLFTGEKGKRETDRFRERKRGK